MNFSSIYMNFVFCFFFSFRCIFIIIFFWKTSLIFCLCYFLCWRRLTSLMSISDGLDPYLFRRKMEKTRSMKEEMGGEVFISARVVIFSFIDRMIKKLFPICTLSWRVNTYVSRQGKDKNRKNGSIIIII